MGTPSSRRNLAPTPAERTVAVTTLSLTGLWMAPVGDLADILWLKISTEQETATTSAGVRRYAGGRDRIISTPGRSQTVPFTAVDADRATWDELNARLGVLQLFRDSRGRAIYGMIAAVAGVEWNVDPTTLEDISFAVQSVTYSEIV